MTAVGGRDVAPAELVDEVRAKLDALAIPCPDCGKPMVSARIFQARTGAFLGVVCIPCDKSYQVGS